MVLSFPKRLGLVNVLRKDGNKTVGLGRPVLLGRLGVTWLNIYLTEIR